MHQNRFGYWSSHGTDDAVIKAVRNSRCPDVDREVGTRVLSRAKHNSAAKVTGEGKPVRCKAYYQQRSCGMNLSRCLRTLEKMYDMVVLYKCECCDFEFTNVTQSKATSPEARRALLGLGWLTTESASVFRRTAYL